MKTRREFLAGATTTLFLIPLAACASSSPSASPGSEAGACEGIDTTSTQVSEHTHTVCVPDADLSNPPSGGATYTTSSSPDPLATGAPDDGAHTHTVTLTQAELSSIEAGQSVSVMTSNNFAHMHGFAIVRGPST
jgi:hypothetical protein